jgi:bifunctional non-homologous end joining protein LigD
MPLPDFVPPMLAQTGKLPTGADWAAEVKWDGYRVIAATDGAGTVRAWSRNHLDVLSRFPVLAELAALDRPVLLDGELLAFDDDGHPSFSKLQRLAAEPAPLAYVVFDLLHLDGHALLDASYDERRGLLTALAQAVGLGERLPSVHVAEASDDPAALFAATKERGLEGVVCKRRDSRYLPGRRSPTWTKVKHVRDQEVVVIGWAPGEGTRAGRIGSLLLGVRDAAGDPLRFAGHVGTGFTAAVLDDLAGRLAPLVRDTAPVADEVPRESARDATWVEPRLVGEVAFSEWTPDGRLRHPAWRGLRDDKSPAEVVRES